MPRPGERPPRRAAERAPSDGETEKLDGEDGRRTACAAFDDRLPLWRGFGPNAPSLKKVSFDPAFLMDRRAERLQRPKHGSTGPTTDNRTQGNMNKNRILLPM